MRRNIHVTGFSLFYHEAADARSLSYEYAARRLEIGREKLNDVPTD